MFKPKLSKPEQGFSMVEVLVAILIATIFVTATMQVMALATVFRVRAQEYAEATNWIQEDLENVKEQASQVGIANVQSMIPDDAATPLIDELLITTTSEEDFPNDTKIVFQGDGIANPLRTNDTTYYIINSTRNALTKTNTFKVSDTTGGTAIPLGNNSSGSLIAIATARCDATVTRNTGYADKLRDWISDTDLTDVITPDITDVSNVVVNPRLRDNITSPRTYSNANPLNNYLSSKLFPEKRFHLSRTITLSNDSPYNVLKLSYSVASENAHTTLSSAVTATSTTLSVASTSGFKPGDKLTVGTDVDNEIQTISGNTITLTAQIGSDQPANSIVDVSIATMSTEVIPNAALQCP